VFKEQEVSNASPDWPASRVIWCALFHVVNRYVGYLLPMPGVFRDYPAPVIRNTQSDVRGSFRKRRHNSTRVSSSAMTMSFPAKSERARLALRIAGAANDAPEPGPVNQTDL